MPEFHITAPDGTAYNVTGRPDRRRNRLWPQVQAMHAKENGGILKNIGAGAVGARSPASVPKWFLHFPRWGMWLILSSLLGKGPQAATPLINQELTRVPNKLAGPLNPDTVSQLTLPKNWRAVPARA